MPCRHPLIPPLVALGLLFSSARLFAADTPSALESTPDGWADLLALSGTDLKGWTRLPIPPKPDAKPSETSQWSIDPKTGYIVCEGNGGHEWLRWDTVVEDGIFHVEFRYTPVTTGKKGYNSGIYTRNSADAAVWHQAQAGYGSGGFLFGETPNASGKLQRFNLSKNAEKREKPAGEWNTYELTCKGKTIALWVNGGETCRFDQCGVSSGHVGLEAEGYRIEFRNVKLKMLAREKP